jgi:hypothetical protein
VALGASTGVAVRRAGGAGGTAGAAPPVAVRRCRPAQPIRKLTTAAFAVVDVGNHPGRGGTDWPILSAAAGGAHGLFCLLQRCRRVYHRGESWCCVMGCMRKRDLVLHLPS